MGHMKAWLTAPLLLLVLFLLARAQLASDEPEDVQCNEEAAKGSALLQFRAKAQHAVSDILQEEKANRTDVQVDNARFLMQATFGPTRQSMRELDGKTYEKWIRIQMRLPEQSHREHFRARVNPRYDAPTMPTFSSIGPCEKGSRWIGYAFTRGDVKSAVSVRSDIKVAGTWVSDVDPSGQGNGIAPMTCTDNPMPEWRFTCKDKAGFIRRGCQSGAQEWTGPKVCQQTCFDYGYPYPGDDCSGGWTQYKSSPFNGYICQVEEGVGGMVWLSKSKSCNKPLVVRNPAIWCTSCPSPVNEVSQDALVSNPLLPGRVFLQQDTAGCDWVSGGMIRSDGKIYRFESHMALLDNLPESPVTFADRSCVKRSFLNEDTCRVLPATEQEGCFQACGSPGETANDGSKGHQMAMGTKVKTSADRLFDNRYSWKQPKDLSKTVVWTELALTSQDQLRQRAAWALAQIFVVGVFNDENEIFLAYYDIFVRNAFRSLRDILREITYSPVMGKYLTYRGSKSMDSSGDYADENFAREIMQLFTIGLSMLHSNGSAVINSQKEEVPTYSNEHIMNFARVFTGFTSDSARGNIEASASGNMIDPMVMRGRFHDVYPKPDLYGGFLGDGYPLCYDLPERAFLKKGARYEFRGYVYAGNVLELTQGSSLFEALCGGNADACDFASVVTLPANIRNCQGSECDVSSLSVVKVGGGFYEYAMPPCVFSFFYNGMYAANPNSFQKRVCVDPLSRAAGTSCCRGGGGGGGGECDNTPGPQLTKMGRTCENAEETWKKKGVPVMSSRFCNKKKSWRKNKYCQLECFNLGLGYDGDNCSRSGAQSGPQDKLICSDPTQRMSFSSAQAICTDSGMDICSKKPNANCGDSMYVWTDVDCKDMLRVHADGKVSGHTDKHAENRFSVSWAEGGAPAAGNYTATVEVKAVFMELPSRAQLMANLTIGAFKPKGSCTAGCSGAVKAYGPSEPMDTTTVFECDGNFFRNIESLVHVQGENLRHTFRNPPVFIPSGPLQLEGNDLNRAALAEVESLLDHLFYHPNTAVFIGKKLAQRFVTSNPSADYLGAIGEAFRTGTYGNTAFSGKYGDLGATIAAILLHPEARSSTATSHGLLREPMLKLVHFMRSMEYEDAAGEYVAFQKLDEIIGQFPYHSPTVFNFYTADYMPSRFTVGEPEPEPEPEPEQSLVAPEFQIFTAPFAMNFLNGMSSLLEYGVSDCEEGFGIRVGARSCKQGALAFNVASEDEALREMDLLLTGGRLTPGNAGIVKQAYDSAQEGGQLQAAQQAILLMPEFHNLGDPLPNGTRPPPALKPDHAPKDYKAVVMLFLAGGADTFHMLVPIGCSLYDEYKQVRGDAAHKDQTQLLPIKGNNPTNCANFGIHPSMSFIADLYENDRQAAFVSNIGALVEPLTSTTIKGSQKCAGLFSHSHQQNAAQTLQCQIPGAAPRGVGGRMADSLAAKYKVESFSVTGTATWSEGFDTTTEILSPSKGAVRFSKFHIWGDVIDNITRQRHGNVYCEEYAQAFSEAIESSETLGAFLDNVTLETNYTIETGLQKQLHQVARLIRAHHDRKAERDFFFVQIGGWDTHGELHATFAEKMAEVDGAIQGFVQELKGQREFENVVLMTASDFGRTLTFNGQGTDHGWGGNHFIIGGSIKGKQIFNDFPSTFVLGTEYINDRGRVIPKYPWENMMVPVAEWLGVEDPATVFPNLGNFNRTEHIISRELLFSN